MFKNTKRKIITGLAALVLGLASCGVDEGESETGEPPKDYSQTPRTVSIEKIAYSPYERGQGPNISVYPTTTQMGDDIDMLPTACVRFYGSEGTLFELPRLCEEQDVDFYIGTWIDANTSNNQVNIARTKQQADANYKHAKGVILGNEVLQRGDKTESELTAMLDDMNAYTALSVSYADNYTQWLNHPNLANHVDFITVHIHPYWDGVLVDNAAQYVADKYNQMVSAFPGKTIIIGETGWPTGGNTVGQAVPSEANQEKFFDNFQTLSKTSNIQYFWFSGFDEEWKTAVTGIEAEETWGLYREDRTPKQALQ